MCCNLVGSDKTCRDTPFSIKINKIPKLTSNISKMDYNSLLQQARKLVNDTQFNDDLPPMERTLPQVLQETQELHARVTQTGALDTQA